MGKKDDFKDKDFGEKLAHLAGILGHRYASRKFVRKNLAAELDVNESQLSHMVNGTRGIPEEFLARLVAAFDLHRNDVTYEDFYLPLSDFKALTRKKRVGLHGDISVEQARQLLTAKTIDEKKKTNGLRVQVRQVNSDCHRRGGGIGGDTEPPNELLSFEIGDFAVVQIENLEPGHLIVLNDQLGVEVTVLMPSRAAPEIVVRRPGSLTLPTAQDMHAFPVGAPQTPRTAEPVLYRVYAIWTQFPFSMSHLLEQQPKDRLLQWSYFELTSLVSGLEAAGATGWRAASQDYYVTKK